MVRATLIFGLIVVFTALMGCKRQNAESEPLRQIQYVQQKVVSEAQNLELIAELKAIKSALQSDNADEIVEVLAPPVMRRAVADGLGLPTGDYGVFDSQLRNQLLEVLSMIQFTDVTFDYEAIEYQVSDGRIIAIVPTAVEVEISGQKFASRGNYLGIRRESRWVVLSPSDSAAVKNMKSAFPELANIPFAAMTIELVR